MRIISQNLMDFPYEQIVVAIDDNKVICRPVNDMGGRYYTLGVYRDEERAEEVLGEIAYFHNNPKISFNIGVLSYEKVFSMPEE